MTDAPERTAEAVFRTIESGEFYADYDQSVADLGILRKHLLDTRASSPAAVDREAIMELIRANISTFDDVGVEESADAILSTLTPAPVAELKAEIWRLKRELDHVKMVDKCGDAIGGFDPDQREQPDAVQQAARVLLGEIMSVEEHDAWYAAQDAMDKGGMVEASDIVIAALRALEGGE